MRRAKVAAGIVLTAPFIPMIFQGEEFAASTPFQYFADHEDPEMAKAVREGRQREFAAFGWDPNEIPDPEKLETFEQSKLNWNEIEQDSHGEMLDWYRRLIDLRRRSASLNDGDMRRVSVEFDEKEHWLTMNRGQVRVLCNLGDKPAELENPAGLPLILASDTNISIKDKMVVLPPDSLAILSDEKV